ncbi:hypothetical protein C0J52_00647 [Blattella germanica]|nr:hypothetical protein C0J52_00647 [Blattella germanica]
MMEQVSSLVLRLKKVNALSSSTFRRGSALVEVRLLRQMASVEPRPSSPLKRGPILTANRLQALLR